MKRIAALAAFAGLLLWSSSAGANSPRVETFADDPAGNRVSYVNFKGEEVVREFDVMNREIVRRFPDGTEILFTYTPMGLVETITDARGVTRYSYTPRDDIERIEYPNGQWITYENTPAAQGIRQRTAPIQHPDDAREVTTQHHRPHRIRCQLYRPPRRYAGFQRRRAGRPADRPAPE